METALLLLIWPISSMGASLRHLESYLCT